MIARARKVTAMVLRAIARRVDVPEDERPEWSRWDSQPPPPQDPMTPESWDMVAVNAPPPEPPAPPAPEPLAGSARARYAARTKR